MKHQVAARISSLILSPLILLGSVVLFPVLQQNRSLSIPSVLRAVPQNIPPSVQTR